MTDDRSMRMQRVMRQRHFLSAGFTLVELMVTLAIASVLLLALAAMFIAQKGW